MDENKAACERVEEVITRILDGERLDASGRQEALEHLEACGACRRRYALDLALVSAISDAPEIPHTSVAADAVRIARARLKRISILRWGAVVGAVCGVLAVTNAFGYKVFDFVLDLLLGGRASTEVAAGSKVLSLIVGLAGTARGLLVGGLRSLLGGRAAAYRLDIMLAIIGIGLMVILMMYAMELWLRRPRGVRLWH